MPRIALIADTHVPEAPVLWPQVFDAFQGVDAILHAGDIHDVGVLDALHQVAPVWAVRGNGDDGSGGRPIQLDHPRLRVSWVIDLFGFKIGLVHDLPMFECVTPAVGHAALASAFGDRRLDVVVSGDTHVEAIELVNDVLCVNPGSPTFPHNLELQFGTVGFLDVDELSITASIWRIGAVGVEPFDWTTWRRPVGSRRRNLDSARRMQSIYDAEHRRYR